MSFDDFLIQLNKFEGSKEVYFTLKVGSQTLEIKPESFYYDGEVQFKVKGD